MKRGHRGVGGAPDGGQHSGQVVEWHDDRGYGFIRDDSGSRFFFHATDVWSADQRPMLGDLVTFGIAPGRDGRPSARPVRITGTGDSVPVRSRTRDIPTSFGFGSRKRIAAAALLSAGALAGAASGQLPMWVLLVYFGMGAVSAGLYWTDKAAAQKDAWRIPESTLHLMDVLGGIVGGLMAQVILRHKTRKAPFVAVTSGIVLLHGAVAGGALLGYRLLPL